MARLVLEGKVYSNSEYAPARSGRGRLIVDDDSGVRWEIPNFFGGGRADEGEWHQMHTFGREGSTLHIAWMILGPGGSKLLAGVRFMSRGDSARAIEIARRHLPASGWRSNRIGPDGQKLDDIWSLPFLGDEEP